MSLSAAAWIAIGAACAAGAALAVSVVPRPPDSARSREPARPARRRQGRPRRLRRLAPGAASTTSNGAVDEVAAALARVDRRVDGSITNTSLVRYDAYEGAGGHQSASIALLDAGRSGIVVSAIQGRDYARIYVKELDRGQPNVALSPEEQEAVEKAMAAT